MTISNHRTSRCWHALIGVALLCSPGIAAAQEAVGPSFVDPAVHDGDKPYFV